jgi:hypothetical protein
MPIQDRNLEPGTVLAARYKGKHRTCEVVQTDDGLRYQLDNGELFNSPSSAGKAAMGGVACNGWRFWSVAGTERPRRERKAKPATKPSTKKPAAKKKTTKTKKPRGKSAAMKSSDSYGCGVCGATFPTQKAAVAHAMPHTG